MELIFRLKTDIFFRLIYLINTLKSRDSRSLMHAENSYEMPKYLEDV